MSEGEQTSPPESGSLFDRAPPEPTPDTKAHSPPTTEVVDTPIPNDTQPPSIDNISPQEVAGGGDKPNPASSQDDPSSVQAEAAVPDQEPQAVPPTTLSVDEVVVINILILPDRQTHQEVLNPGEKVQFLKEVLADRFKIRAKHIRLKLGGYELDDIKTLYEYRHIEASQAALRGSAPAPSLNLVMTIEYTDPGRSDYKMPDVIAVNLDTGGGEPVQVLVQVIRENILWKKPFLGGFRHKVTGRIYHHATCQTLRRKKTNGVQKFHRETQTVDLITRSQQTNREAGTQMDRKDLYIDHSNDKIIMARPYVSIEQLDAMRDAAAKEIQCCLRQCFAWRRVRRLREAREDEIFRKIREKQQKKKEAEEEHKRQIRRRMHPRTKADFAILYKELEAWRLHETARIKNSDLFEEEIHAKLQELLSKEVKLLQTIDRLKITAAKENKTTRTKETLEKMASPKEWKSSEGDLVEVETPFTTRAKELVELYNGLTLRNLPRAQRVDVLLHVKYTVKEFDCELTRDIVELIKREEDLLCRGRSEKSLGGLRNRLANLFLQFVNTPEFNPEAANFQKVPFVTMNPNATTGTLL